MTFPQGGFPPKKKSAPAAPGKPGAMAPSPDDPQAKLQMMLQGLKKK